MNGNKSKDICLNNIEDIPRVFLDYFPYIHVYIICNIRPFYEAQFRCRDCTLVLPLSYNQSNFCIHSLNVKPLPKEFWLSGYINIFVFNCHET